MLQSVAYLAGTGKTRVLAAIARAWNGPVFGTATSQNATNGLRQAGIRVAANTTRLLGAIRRGQIPPGSLILADEASMISLTHLAAIAEYAARNGCKLILAGDQEQLAAVEGGGAMTLLADRLGYVQLAEPVRFTAAWERAQRSSAPPSHSVTWPDPATSPPSSMPASARASTRCSRCDRAPGPDGCPGCPTQPGTPTWPG